KPKAVITAPCPSVLAEMWSGCRQTVCGKGKLWMDFSESYSDSVGSVSAAARSGSLAGVRTLIQAGLSLDVRDNRGWTCLHEVASSTLDFRLFVNAQTHEGETPLFLAARLGHVSVVKLLLKGDADIDLQTNDLSCPLYTGKHSSDPPAPLVFWLWLIIWSRSPQGHGEIVDLLSANANLESFDDHHITPLFLAAQYGQLTCLKKLIAAGAKVNVQASDGATPLQIASQEGHEEVVAELLANRGNPNKMCLNMWRWPELPIHAAAQFGHIGYDRLIPVTDRCIDRGLDQVSPVYMSVMSDQRGALQLLLADGFSPDAQDSEELLGLKCPLSLAVDLATPGLGSARALTEREVEGLVKECGSQVQNSSMWMPLLLKAGLDPHALLQDEINEIYTVHLSLWRYLGNTVYFTHSKLILFTKCAAVYLIFSSLSAESIPSLFHLCRLLIRDVLGSASVTKTTVLDQLPVPLLFHHFLQFKDVQ
uniref:SOCS box domain-containing protein n=1 Tax=Neogobius melanostomus TaxID=47308 RepID=A0A8C6UG48_9GOBI